MFLTPRIVPVQSIIYLKGELYIQVFELSSPEKMGNHNHVSGVGSISPSSCIACLVTDSDPTVNVAVM